MECTESYAELLARIEGLRATVTGRVTIGVTGAPGSGKSTLVESLLHDLDGVGYLPMDGFHLSDRELIRQNIVNRKGAIDTFDAHGYLATLTRVRMDLTNPIYVPGFDRELEQPIAAMHQILPSHQVVLTEGNYILDRSEPWVQVGNLLTESWFCQLDTPVRIDRLIKRHAKFGKSHSAAVQWVAQVDEKNAHRVAQTQQFATLTAKTNKW